MKPTFQIICAAGNFYWIADWQDLKLIIGPFKHWRKQLQNGKQLLEHSRRHQCLKDSDQRILKGVGHFT